MGIGILRIEDNYLPQEFSRARSIIQLLLGDGQQVECGGVARIQAHGGFELVPRFLVASEIE